MLGNVSGQDALDTQFLGLLPLEASNLSVRLVPVSAEGYKILRKTTRPIGVCPLPTLKRKFFNVRSMV